MQKILVKARKAIDKGDFSSAKKILNQVLEKNPNDPAFLMMRGEVFLRSENYEAARTDYAVLVEMEPSNIEVLSNFSVALIRCNQQHEALKILEYILELDPKNFAAYINLGNVYQTLKQPELNLKNAFKAVETNPKSPIAFNNLGTALGDLQMNEESREAFLTSVALAPNYVPALINLAQVQDKLGDIKSSMLQFEALLKNKKITPNQFEFIKYYLSYPYLYFGRLKEGWQNYESGFGALLPSEALRSLRRFHQPKWKGENIKGKRILLWREQGLGDEIMFSTCFHELLDLGATVVVECEPRLVSVFKRAYPSFEIRIPMVGDDRYSLCNDFDVHCAFGSLLHLFRNKVEDFYKPKPVLSPDIENSDKFKNRLEKYKHQGKTLVGICWRSGYLSVGRNQHYTSLLDWRELLSDSNFQFVNLQYDNCEEELIQVETELGISIIRWSDIDLKNDLDSVFGIISNLDCVISAPTAVCQMAGASGKKTFLLTRREWTLLGTQNQYPWHPTVTPIIAENDAHIAANIPALHEMLKEDFLK